MGKVKPTRDMELGRHARKTIQVIRDRGHTVRMDEDDKGRVCLIGGLRKAVAPMGRQRSSTLVREFNERFGVWMKDRFPEAQVVKEFSTLETLGLFSAPPATIWNDRVLLHGDEACAWLGKFADDLDPQR